MAFSRIADRTLSRPGPADFRPIAAILALTCLVASHGARADLSVLTLQALDRASARDVPADGVFDEIVAGEIFSWNGYSDLRHAAEFNLASVPREIITAMLKVQTGQWSPGARGLQVHGHAGDGAVALEDFAGGALLGANPIVSGAWDTQSLDVTEFIRDLVQNSEQWAGFNIREEPQCDPNVLDCVNISVGSLALEIQFVETVLADGFEQAAGSE